MGYIMKFIKRHLIKIILGVFLLVITLGSLWLYKMFKKGRS